MTETVEVPFVKIGNRRALTGEQLARHRYLADFVKRFEQSFERDYFRDLWVFIEPEDRA